MMEFTAVFWLLMVLNGLAVGAFCAWIAGKKNYSGGIWFALGFFFSWLALIAIGVVPSQAAQRKQCPYCWEPVDINATACHHCDRVLP